MTALLTIEVMRCRECGRFRVLINGQTRTTVGPLGHDEGATDHRLRCHEGWELVAQNATLPNDKELG